MTDLQQNALFGNRYLLKKLIGVGGYSQVWLAEDTKSGNLEVAIKIFAPGQGLDDKGLELFSKEYSLVFNLNHPGLLKPTYFDDFEGSPYLVMQYCNQGSAFGKIGEISETELAHFIQQSASALNYLHQQDPPIIHQDIKPDNFLIDNQGNYLLADFGISSKIRRTLTKSIGAHASTGTLAYMPPEKFSADKQIIKAGDIFSLGVTMYELLTGDLPFGENGGLTLKAGADVPNLPGNFSKELNHLLISCMAKNPWERPPAEQLEVSAKSFLDDNKWSSIRSIPIVPNIDFPEEPKQTKVGRLTQVVPLPEPSLEKLPKTETALITDTESLKNLTPFIIFVIMCVIGIVISFAWPKVSTEEEQFERARLDSIALADSLAIVAAEQARLADSAVKVQNLNNDASFSTIIWPDGDRYSGEWKGDKMEGQGTYTLANGEKYVGHFKNSQFNGKGIYTWPDGSYYDGYWKDDKRHGFGKEYNENGKLVYEGRFQDDQPAEIYPNR